MVPNNSHSKEEHEKVIEKANAQMPDEKTISGLSEIFKALSDPSRLRILYAIGDGEVCVCCISDMLGMSVSAVSHQLKTLKQAKLIKARRDGRNIHYSLDDLHVRAMQDIMSEHLREPK